GGERRGGGPRDLVLGWGGGRMVLLQNEGKGLFPRARDWGGLTRGASRWNGVAVGDIDGDGRLDLVATSWGRNTDMSADSARPLYLLHGSFGAAGEEEMLLARQDDRLHAIAPLNSYARLRVAVP